VYHTIFVTLLLRLCIIGMALMWGASTGVATCVVSAPLPVLPRDHRRRRRMLLCFAVHPHQSRHVRDGVQNVTPGE
jgi:hypothetical protein